MTELAGTTERERIPVGFLGYGTRALDALMTHEGFDVRVFLAPLSRLCEDVYVARRQYPEIPFQIVKDNAAVKEAFLAHQDLRCFVMNACPIILNEEVLGTMPVYNIHPGNLENNRGHHPHMWTVLKREKDSMIVMHETTPGIDEGRIIKKIRVDMPREATSLEVLDLLEDRVPELLDALHDTLTGKYEPTEIIMGGTYRQMLTYADYELKPQEATDPDSFREDMLCKIRARFTHHGAFLLMNGERVYVDKLLWEEETEASPAGWAAAIHGKTLFLDIGTKRFILRLNNRAMGTP